MLDWVAVFCCTPTTRFRCYSFTLGTAKRRVSFCWTRKEEQDSDRRQQTNSLCHHQRRRCFFYLEPVRMLQSRERDTTNLQDWLIRSLFTREHDDRRTEIEERWCFKGWKDDDGTWMFILWLTGNFKEKYFIFNPSSLVWLSSRFILSLISFIFHSDWFWNYYVWNLRPILDINYRAIIQLESDPETLTSVCLAGWLSVNNNRLGDVIIL